MRSHPHRGYVSMLTMVLLVVGFTLCLWLYTTLGSATAVTKNELDGTRAMAAAESGLDAVMYELRNVTAKTGFRRTRTMVDEESIDRGLLSQLCIGVRNHYALGNMAGPLLTEATLPRFAIGPVGMADNCSYSAEMTMMKRPDNYGHGYTIEVKGVSGRASRTICLDLTPQLVFGSSSMDYAIASKGEMNLPNANNGNHGIFRYDPVTGAPTDDLGMAVQAPDGSWYLKFENTPPPSGNILFPDDLPSEVYDVLDAMKTSGRLTTVAPGSTIPSSNVYISPSSANNPATTTFPSGATLSGIIYVGWPNNIDFGSNLQLNGIIIYEQPPAPLAEGSTSPCSIKIGRQLSLVCDPAIAKSSIATVLSQMPLTTAQQADTLGYLTQWGVNAPNTNLILENGNTEETREFTGNLHVRDLLGAGSGSADPGNLIISGQISCEGNVQLGGNRVFCIEPPDQNDNPEAIRRLKLDANHGGYWEPVQ